MAEEPTLAFVVKQLNKVLDRMGAIEDQITVLTRIHDAAGGPNGGDVGPI